MEKLTPKQRHNINEFLELVSRLPLTHEQKIIFINKMIHRGKIDDEKAKENKNYFNTYVLPCITSP